jgi:hypothetical protein
MTAMMITKGTNFTVREMLKITDKAKNGDAKAILFGKYKIIASWFMA